MVKISPIGFFESTTHYKYDAPRQGVFFAEHPGVITLNSGENFEMALRDLDGFERIWVIFLFHENSSWRPTTRPPVPALGKERIGTFASRSPYRPNPIGMSAVKLLKIEGRRLWIDEADLLNGTPILDIKPYIPKVDAFPQAKAGWVDAQINTIFEIAFSEIFEKEHAWLKENSPFDLKSFAQKELSMGLDVSRKRMVISGTQGVLAYRTFRIHFTHNAQKIFVEKITSGYTPQELNDVYDKYNDKNLHRHFIEVFYSENFAEK